MGIELYFSNQLMPLAERLHENLMPGGDPVNILDPPMVIVPNMNISKWIKLTLARKSDIFMNVEFQYLESGLWRMIRSLDRENAVNTDLLDIDHLKILLCFILMAADRGDAAIAPVNRYLHGTGDVEIGDLEIRAWQLAGQLAQLFREYDYHRSDMIRRWRLTEVDAAGIVDPIERCQCRIYRKMLELKEGLARPLYTLAEYAHTVLSETATIDSRGGLSQLSNIHLFGLSQISPFHLSLLERMKSHFEIHIYSLNPSREFWEDIKTPYEKKWIARKNVSRLKVTEAEILSGDLDADADHALLSAWGKPGRESIRMLCHLTDYDFHAGFAEIQSGESVLGTIAHQLLTLDGGMGAKPAMRQDTSLQIVACPGIRREVETVYNSILHNLETDSDLCMTDIAVMVSDMSRYKPVVDAVFKQQPKRISYNLVDSNARRESVFAQAVMAILALCQGRFTRKQVFDLLQNPCVMNRWMYGAQELGVWIDWAEALGIFYGYENTGGAETVVPAAGLYSWRQGLERLRMSRIMTAPDHLPGSPEHHYQGIVPYIDTNTGDERLVEKFCAVVETLHNALSSLQIKSAPAQVWRDRFLDVVEQFVELSPEMRGEAAVYQSLIEALEGFVSYDALMQMQSGRPLTIEALRVFVNSHLEGLAGGHGDYLTGGITVSALMPMRPIPFKVVYVLGLEEGRFPGQAIETRLDLRCRQRRIGDISTVERNRYLFLEILVSVSRKLYLSYVARDLQKDRDQAPSSVIHQLRQYIEAQVLGGAAFKVCRIPIAPDSETYIAPHAVCDWSDVRVNYSVSHRLSCYRRLGLWDTFVRQATPDILEAAARHQPDFSLPAPVPDEKADAALTLTLGTLRQFIVDPVLTVSRHHLDIDEQEDPNAEIAEKEDEPIASQFPVDYQLRTLPVNYWLAAQMDGQCKASSLDSLESAFDTVYENFLRRSSVPIGAFAVNDHAWLKQDVMNYGNNLTPIIEQMRAAKRCFSGIEIGADMDAGEGGTVLNMDPVTIALPASGSDRRPPSVQLNGGMPWVWQVGDETWHCLVVCGAKCKNNYPSRYVINPLLTFLVISSVAGEGRPTWFSSGRITIHIVYRDQLKDFDYRLDPERSRAYLADLVCDFFTPTPLLWLPFETICGKSALRKAITAETTDAVVQVAFRQLMAEQFAESVSMQAELAGAVVTPDILDHARRRLRIFLA